MEPFSSQISNPNSFVLKDCVMTFVSNSSVHVDHSHPGYSYIVEHFNELITPFPGQPTVEKIQQLVKETEKCLLRINSLYPVDSTKENAMLRGVLKREVKKDENILRFLETVFIQLSLKQMEEMKQKRELKTKRKLF